MSSFTINENIIFFNIFLKDGYLYLICPINKDTDLISKKLIIISNNKELVLKQEIIKDRYEATQILIYEFPLINNIDEYEILVKYNNNKKNFIIKNIISNKKYKLTLTTLFKTDFNLINIFYDYYKKQGVQHFYLYYNDEFTENITNLCNKKDITLIQWNYPYWNKNAKHSRHFAQLGQMHDAIYRFGKDNSDYMIFCDLDEYMNVKNNKLINLVEDNKVDTFGFRNIWANTLDNKVSKFFPNKFKIGEKFTYRIRSKCIHKMDTVEHIGVHFGTKFKNKELVKSDYDMYHFHNWGGDNVTKYVTLKDISVMLDRSIILVGPPGGNIPPRGWGACESIVWDYYCNLKDRGYKVEFISEKSKDVIINFCNSRDCDVVHIMYDNFIEIASKLNCENIYGTSHYAYITHPNFEKKEISYFNNIFKKCISVQNKLNLLVLSEEIKDIYIKFGFDSNKIKVLQNGAREDKFKFVKSPKNIGKSIYVGKIENRKRQYKYQNIPDIDFAGNYYNSTFDVKNKNYLGEWTKDVLYNNLTEYSNLILLSDGEADPLVVKEALICGLGVVVSKCASANLDLNKNFIDVIEDDKLDDISYVKEVIDKNREVCKIERFKIREYGLNNFSWSKIIDKYCEITNI